MLYLIKRYRMNRTLPFILACILLFTNVQNSQAQKSPEKAIKRLGPNPIFIIDSIRVEKDRLSNQNPADVTSLQMLYDQEAMERFGPSAKDGVVIVETRTFSRNKFISYFRKKSLAYDSLFVKNSGDRDFIYIINDKVQEGNYEGNVGAIDDEVFISLTILDQTQLQQKYKVNHKLYGISISSKKPKDLYRKEEKF